MGRRREQYFTECNTFLTLPYLKIYSNSNDPWTSQDSGGNCLDVLFEFQAAWTGSPFPGNANLAHMLSGGNLGCGVAYLDVLCDNVDGFAVSGNLHGMTSFPVPTQDSLNWDFIVTAHETGHNFGTLHTHDYCPPIDQCAPSGYFGQCQTQQVCQVGTIMSYCHLCSGGIFNSKTEFGPIVAAVMLAEVQSSCLASFPPASHVVRNGTGVNPLGYAALNEPEIGGTWMASVDIVTPGAVASFIGVVSSGPLGVPTALGEVLIDITQPFVAPVSAGVGMHSFPVPDDMNMLGLKFYSQAATFKVGSVRLQNAIDLCFGY